MEKLSISRTLGDGEVKFILTYPKDESVNEVENTFDEMVMAMKHMLSSGNTNDTKTKKQRTSSDLAIARYTSDRVTVDVYELGKVKTHKDNTAERLNEILLKGNHLKLNPTTFTDGKVNYLCDEKINWCTIQTLDVSCPEKHGDIKDANSFLTYLFKTNKSLRSLRRIDITNTNVTMDTLLLWKNQPQTAFSKELIRPENNYSQAFKQVNWANLSIIGSMSTPVKDTTMKQKLELQCPGDVEHSMLTPEDDFSYPIVVRLRITLD
jgi:hypothetical protein